MSVRVLEEGNIYFAYRPKVDADVVREFDDVQRLFMVLQPEQYKFRLIVVGRKKLPKPGPYQRFWGVVDTVSEDAEPIKKEFAAYEYQTKTRGVRQQKAVEMFAQGSYALYVHDDHSHLGFFVRKSAADLGFNIPTHGDYIVTAKNPMMAAPPFAGGAYSGEADYPPHLRHRFGGYRFMPLGSAELLDYRDAQIVLIASDHGIGLGTSLPTQQPWPAAL